MRIYKGLFYDKRCLISEQSSEYSWEGRVKGLVCEAGGCYFYIIECKDGMIDDEYYLPRESVNYIKILPEVKEEKPRETVMDVLEVGEVIQPNKLGFIKAKAKSSPDNA